MQFPYLVFPKIDCSLCSAFCSDRLDKQARGPDVELIINGKACLIPRENDILRPEKNVDIVTPK